MASWKSAADLSRRYLVGLERLADYSRRGNLPMRVAADGAPLFDEDIVALLFRSRSAASVAPGSNLGVLGEMRLGGAEPAQPMDAREMRRREVWRQQRENRNAIPAATPRRTGTR